jgi:hypothetical protein
MTDRMENKEFSQKLEERTKRFAIDECNEMLAIFTSIAQTLKQKKL